MHRCPRWSALTAAVSLLSCTHAAARQESQAGPPATAEASNRIAPFTRHSRFVDARISPKGTYLAAISLEGGKRSLAFVDMAKGKVASVFSPAPLSVGEFYWVSDSRVVVALWDEVGTLAAPVDYGEIYGIDADGGRGQMIFGYRAAKNREIAWASILGRLRNDGRRILIESADYRAVGESIPTLYKLDVYNGFKSPVAVSPVPRPAFLTDENGEPRIASGIAEDVKPRYFYRDTDQGWIELARLKGVTPRSRPVGFVSRSRTLEIVEPLEKGFGLFEVNIDSGERRLLSENEWVPPRSYLRDETTSQILAVEYEPDVPVYDVIVPDHPLSRVLRGLLERYPDSNVRILNATDDMKKAVVLVYSDVDAGKFLLVDVDKTSAEEIVATRPWSKPEAMAQMTAFHIPASDGMVIHGYLTLPRNSTSGESRPMVVLPHGGPHFVRNFWGFDREVQLLANEGFVVLQVNYRGSGGYGSRFQEAGYMHWGDRVVQDIVDATRYAVKKGHADPRRICIYGGSFGGYAAIQSVVVAPGLFRCAIGYAGVYDLTLMSSEGDIAQTRLGRGFVSTVLGKDVASLKRISPVYNASRVQARVLLIHGRKDERAPIAHAEALQRALAETGDAAELIVEPKEGHGFYDEGARERMYMRLLEFLRANTNTAPSH